MFGRMVETASALIPDISAWLQDAIQPGGVYK